MPGEVVHPKVRGFICTSAHPTGCAANVANQIEYIQSCTAFTGPKTALVVGASTGYGLASRIALAFGANAKTIGVFFEKAAKMKRTATAGWYNSAAFEQHANQANMYAKSINGDAFSNEIKQQVADLIRKDWGKVDCLVYSLASPRRIHPDSGQAYSSVLKPIGDTYTNHTVNTQTGDIHDVTIEPATSEEIASTVTVMGGDDWQRWINFLREYDLLANDFTTVAYSYIGPELTYPIYTNGTIGQAKQDLQDTAERLNKQLASIGGRAVISINKALVTQSSSAIPVVPLYMSILFKIMKANDTNEHCIEQMHRLFAQHVFSEQASARDDQGRIRLDNLEMLPEVQAKVASIWSEINTDNLDSLADLPAYQQDFYQLFGFNFEEVDYDQAVETHVPIASLEDQAAQV